MNKIFLSKSPSNTQKQLRDEILIEFINPKVRKKSRLTYFGKDIVEKL